MGRAAALLAVLALAGVGVAAPVNGGALRREADVLLALRARADGVEGSLRRLASGLRLAGADVEEVGGDDGAPTWILGVLEGRDEPIGSEAVLVVTPADGDAEAAALLPSLMRALSGREGLPKRRVLVLVAPAKALESARRVVWRDETIVAVIELEGLEGSAGRPAVECDTTEGLRRTLDRARGMADIFLWLPRGVSKAPDGDPERVVVREPVEAPFTTAGPPSERSLGRVGDFVVEVVRTLADAVEDPPLGLAVPLESTPAAMLERAGRLAGARRFTEALGLAARALTEHPEAHEVRLFRAGVLLDLNRPDAARAEAETVLRAVPDDPGARLVRGRAAEAVGDEETALADYEVVLAKRAGDVEALARRGLIRVRREEVAEAQKDFVAALGSREHPIALKGQGMAFFYEREYAKALVALDRSVKLDQDDWESWFYRGLVRLFRGRADALDPTAVAKSLADFTSAITADPRQPLPYRYRGELYLGRNEFEKARADYDRAIRLRPDDSHLYFQRGLASLSLDRFEPAISDFAKVIELDPTEPAAPYNIACAYAKSSRTKEAMAWLEKAIAAGFLNDPTNLDHMRRDPDLESLRKLPAFERLLKANRVD